jgi:hypothetical protein
MLHAIYEWVINFKFNTLLAIGLYWVPLALCLYGYTIKTWTNYQIDAKKREEDSENYYYPTDRLGDLIGRVIISVCPIWNLGKAIFDVAPRVFASFFRLLDDILNIPLVPPRPKKVVPPSNP